MSILIFAPFGYVGWLAYGSLELAWGSIVYLLFSAFSLELSIDFANFLDCGAAASACAGLANLLLGSRTICWEYYWIQRLRPSFIPFDNT